MRILVCGDRHWTNRIAIHGQLATLPKGTVIIEGAASGADQIAGFCARSLGFDVQEFPANWAKYGRAAGPIRNKQMLTEGKPDQVWAFHADIASSKGTANMVAQSKAAGIPVTIFEK